MQIFKTHIGVGESNESIENIKLKMIQKEGISTNSKFFLFSTQLLQNEILKDYNNSNHLNHLISKLGLKGGVQILVKTLTGKMLTLEVEGNDTIGDVKLKIQDRENIPMDEQRIIYAGKELKDEITLLESNIYQKDSVVHMIIKKKGG